MPLKQFLAVTPIEQWCCANCGCNYEPAYLGRYDAVISKRGPARMVGSHLFPPPQPQRDIELVGNEISCCYVCSDCGEKYEPIPVEGSIAEMIQEEEIETLSLDIPEGMDVGSLVPGQGGILYGVGYTVKAENTNPFPRRSKGFYLTVRRMASSEIRAVQSKDGKGMITWDYGKTGVTFSDRLPEDYVKSLDKCFKGVNGDIPMSVDELHDMLHHRLVVWVDKEMLLTSQSLINKLISRLMTIFREASWWAHGNVTQLDVLNTRFNHGFSGPAAKKKVSAGVVADAVWGDPAAKPAPPAAMPPNPPAPPPPIKL